MADAKLSTPMPNFSFTHPFPNVNNMMLQDIKNVYLQNIVAISLLT